MIIKNISLLILLCIGINGFAQNCDSLRTQLIKLHSHKELLEKDLEETSSEIKKIVLKIEQVTLKSLNANKFICNSTTITYSRFKSTPSPNSEFIEIIPKNKTIRVLEYVGDCYWKIEYNNQIGYLNEVLIKETSEMVLVKRTTITQGKKFKTKNTRSTRGSNHKTIYTGPKGGRYYLNSNGNKTYVKRK